MNDKHAPNRLKLTKIKLKNFTENELIPNVYQINDNIKINEILENENLFFTRNVRSS